MESFLGAGAGAGRRAAPANGRGRAVHLTARQMQNVTVDGKSGDDGDATIVYDRVSEAVRSLASAATKYAFLTPPVTFVFHSANMEKVKMEGRSRSPIVRKWIRSTQTATREMMRVKVKSI